MAVVLNEGQALLSPFGFPEREASGKNRRRKEGGGTGGGTRTHTAVEGLEILSLVRLPISPHRLPGKTLPEFTGEEQREDAGRGRAISRIACGGG